MRKKLTDLNRFLTTTIPRLSYGAMLFLLLCITHPPAIAQDDQFFTKTYTTEQGLANNHVTNIVQDHNGMLWIATFDGLSRFDGYEFKNYFCDPKDPNSLGISQLGSIAIDRTNTLWIMGRGELYKFDRKTESFIRYKNKICKSATILGQESLPMDNKGHFWFLSSKGFIRYNPANSKTELIQLQDLSLIDKLHRGKFEFDDKGDLWLCYDKKIYHLALFPVNRNYKMLHLMHIYSSHNLKKRITLQSNVQFYFSILHSRKQNIWMTSNDGLFLLDTISGCFTEYVRPIPPGEFSEDQLVKWSNAGNGLFIWDPKENRQITLDNESKYKIETSLIDTQGNIWTGCISMVSEEGLGLKKTVRTGNIFHNVILKNKANGNKNCAVFALARDKAGTAWVGTKDYNYILTVSQKGEMKKEFTIPLQKHIAGASPRTIFFDDSKNAWVGYLGDVLVKYSLMSHKTTIYSSADFFHDSLHAQLGFRRIQKSSYGNLWLGGGYGFCKIDPSNNTVKFSYKNVKPLFYAFYLDERNREYWAGMIGSLYYFKNQKLIRSFELFEDLFDISSILSYNDSTLWLALFGGGIAKFNTHTYKAEQYTYSDGLSNNSTYNIFKDSGNNLWISTNKGISRFNPATKQFWNFDVSDGLFIEEFNGNAAYQGEDGEIFYGGMGGFVRFYPDSVDLQAGNSHASLIISDFRVAGIIQHFDSAVSEKSTFLLQKGQTNFSLNFACIDLKNAEKIKYRYCLKGYNDEWLVTDYKHRYLNYANLKPGKYTCIIEASNIRGEWSNRNTVTITVPPTFFQMTIVRICALLLAVSIVLTILLLIFRNLKRKVEKKEEALRNEVNYRGQMNPHFISNIMTTISGFINKKDEAGVNNFLTTVRDLIRKFLTNSEEDYILLRDELEILELYVDLENQSREQKIEFRLEMDDRLEPDLHKVVPSLIQPLLENSIMHGFRAESDRTPVLKVSFSYSNEAMITCRVEDNGTGRNAAQQGSSLRPGKHKSKAIGNIRNRLKIHSFLNNRTFELRYFDDISEGTVAEINIPARI